MGAPPHGGIASGIDRMSMVLLDEPVIRDTVAFPKNQAGVDPMSGAPTASTQAQLRELGIAVVGRRSRNGRRCVPRRRRFDVFVVEALFLAAVAAALTIAPSTEPPTVVGADAARAGSSSRCSSGLALGEPHYGRGLPPRYVRPAGGCCRRPRRRSSTGRRRQAATAARLRSGSRTPCDRPIDAELAWRSSGPASRSTPAPMG